MKRTGPGRLRSMTDSSAWLASEHDGDRETLLPPAFAARLHDLFQQIEREFEGLYLQNLALQDKLSDLIGCAAGEHGALSSSSFHEPLKSKPSSIVSGGGQKIKAGQKLRVQTNRIVSQLKGQVVSCSLVREWEHKDGVWDVALSATARSSRNGVIASACADMRAMVWDIELAKIVANYTGHGGSVNSVKFIPGAGGEILLTASGDQTAHLWKLPAEQHQRQISSEEEMDPSDEDGLGLGASPASLVSAGGISGGIPAQTTAGSLSRNSLNAVTVTTPLLVLRGHSGVVIAADAFSQTSFDEGKILTASWDRTANLYDGNTGDLITSLVGHDGELTYVRVHPVQRLAVTSSKDTTFRLWDFREPIHSVSVFQGHTEAVNSAVFTTQEDKVVSGSEDRTCKVWDLRNMRSPIAAIQLDSAVNRIAVNSSGVIAIPHDNRHIRLYDIHGSRLARLPRNDRTGHRRMVTAAAWGEDQALSPNLFTCGFDRRICGWKIIYPKDFTSAS